jgi:hypothetical protein
MARFKIYYPVEEITTNLYTTGKQWMTRNGQEYIGLYHKYITGEAYTQPTWQPNKSVELLPYVEQTTSTFNIYQKLKPDINLKHISPRSINITISVDNINQGFITRYFLCKRTDRSIIEVDLLQYNQWKNDQIDKKIYNAVELRWYITGNINDVIEKNITVPGVITKNQESVRIASKTIPELRGKLNNLLEFYTDNTYVVPTDINGLN